MIFRFFAGRPALTASDGRGDDARTRVLFTLALVGWSIAMPRLRRMVLGPRRVLTWSPDRWSSHGERD
ncbi:hypothetical protein ACFY0F_25975 [Streptomyces sp. NPDC001544]|uniref:hypothetical protein n=1 Tax=Streptomyces sp. NPDC001544 TaxID=3364584 RepID=UPI00367453C3